MRIAIIAVTLVAIVAIGITVWFQMQGSNAAPSEVEAPRQYDTTGGQEMRPRWDNGGGQADEATGN